MSRCHGKLLLLTLLAAGCDGGYAIVLDIGPVCQSGYSGDLNVTVTFQPAGSSSTAHIDASSFFAAAHRITIAPPSDATSAAILVATTFNGQPVQKSIVVPIVGHKEDDRQVMLDGVACAGSAPDLEMLDANSDHGTFDQASADLASGPDLSAPPDLAMVDLTTIPDLTPIPPDLAPIADLTAIPDLTVRDLTTIDLMPRPVTFGTRTDLTGSNAAAFVTADVNLDGTPDVVVAGTQSGLPRMWVFINRTSNGAAAATFSAGVVYSVATSGVSVVNSITAADFDGDGKVDIAVGGQTTGSANAVWLLRNVTTTVGTANPTFATSVQLNNGTIATNGPATVAADFDRAGGIDVGYVYQTFTDIDIQFYRNTTPQGGGNALTFVANTTAQIGSTVSEEWAFMQAVELNNNNKIDLLAVSTVAASANIWVNAAIGATFIFSPMTMIAPSPATAVRGVFAADLNGDTWADIVTANHDDNSMSVFLNTTAGAGATPTFSAPTPFSAGIGPIGIGIGDIQGDGIGDVVVLNDSPASFNVLLNRTPTNGTTPLFYDTISFAAPANPAAIQLAQYNGDTRVDVAIRAGGTISVYINTTP